MSTKTATVLVTGGSGLIGHALQKVAGDFPDARFRFVSSRDYDLTLREMTEQMFADVRPDYVIHLAANVGGLYKNMNMKVGMLEKNILINTHVLHYSHVFRVKRLVACLSTCIFPDRIQYPIRETMLHDGPPHASNETYAYAKRLLEIHCRAYREEHGDDFICVIPTNIYGPHDNFNLADAHVIPSLIHKGVLAKEDSTPLTVCGSGAPLRQFIFSEDIARLMLALLFQTSPSPPPPSLMILSTPPAAEVSIADVAQKIRRLVGVAEIRFDPSFSDGQHKKTVDTGLLSHHFPDFSFTPLEEGLARAVEWFVQARMNNCARV